MKYIVGMAFMIIAELILIGLLGILLYVAFLFAKPLFYILIGIAVSASIGYICLK